MTDDDLKALNNDIWKECWPIGQHPPRKVFRESRLITVNELVNILNATKTRPTRPHNACMGFGFGITIYSNPSFPGVRPERLIIVTSDHIIKSGPSFDKTYDLFWPYVDTENNRRLLKLYWSESLRERSYYDY